MFVRETLKRQFERITGRGLPSKRQVRHRIVRRKPQTFIFRDDGRIPNNPLPFIWLKDAVRVDRVADPAALFELVFEANGWGGSWRNGIYDFVHYHSRTHEVLGIARGRARVQFGGAKGAEIDLSVGDVAILPAGTGHCACMASEDLLVVGAYPPEGEYDLCRGSAEEHARAKKSIPNVPEPRTDPVYGRRGPLLRLWRAGKNS